MDAERTGAPPRFGRQDCLLALKLPIPARVPLLYVILGVLLAISVLPMYFYSAQIETMNRERLKTNEMLLQNTVTRSLADEISQHQEAFVVDSGHDAGQSEWNRPERSETSDARTAGHARKFCFLIERHCLCHAAECRRQGSFRRPY
jgi:hypothetical protein